MRRWSPAIKARSCEIYRSSSHHCPPGRPKRWTECLSTHTVELGFKRYLTTSSSKRDGVHGIDAVHPANGLTRSSKNEAITHSSEAPQRVEQLISSLPLVRGLRSIAPTGTAEPASGSYNEFRLYESMNPIALPTHLVYDSLRTQKKLTIDPYLFLRTQPACQAISVFHIGSHLTGHPGYVHGALHCVLFDDLFARCAGMVFSSGVGMTVNLQTNFRRPSLPDRIYVARVEIAKQESRKILLTGSIRSLLPFSAEQMLDQPMAADDGLSREEELGDLVVEGSAIFVEPRFADSMASLFPRT